MMRCHRFWNHDQEFKRYIRNVLRWDYGIISLIDHSYTVSTVVKASAAESGSPATVVHCESAAKPDDFSWVDYMGIPRSGSVLVIQPGAHALGSPNAVAERNAWRIFWVVVTRSQGVMSGAVRRPQKGKEVTLSVSERHLGIVLASLIPIVSRRRSRPLKKHVSIFSALLGSLGRQRPNIRPRTATCLRPIKCSSSDLT